MSGDSQISMDLLKQGYKMLANNIGNLQMRVLKMVQKNLDSKVPSKLVMTDEDRALVKKIAEEFARIYSKDASLEAISELADGIVKAGDMANAYFAANEPWVLAKDPEQKERFAAVVYTTLEVLRLIGLAIYPLTPLTAEKIEKSLGIENPEFAANFNPLMLKEGDDIFVGDPLFPMLV